MAVRPLLFATMVFFTLYILPMTIEASVLRSKFEVEVRMQMCFVNLNQQFSLVKDQMLWTKKWMNKWNKVYTLHSNLVLGRRPSTNLLHTTLILQGKISQKNQKKILDLFFAFYLSILARKNITKNKKNSYKCFSLLPTDFGKEKYHKKYEKFLQMFFTSTNWFWQGKISQKIRKNS